LAGWFQAECEADFMVAKSPDNAFEAEQGNETEMLTSSLLETSFFPL
jgi:hypothetical protein